MFEFLMGQIVGLILGIVAGFIFWFVMLRLKPQVKPTPFIAYSPKDGRFRFKIINNTRRQILDISVTLRLIERVSTPSPKNPNLGKQVTVHRFKLSKDNYFVLAARQTVWGLPFILTVTTRKDDQIYSDLDEMFAATQGGERRLVVTIGSTDSLSNTKNLQRFTFTREDVKYGRFDKEFALIEETKVEPECLDITTNVMGEAHQESLLK